MAKEASSKATKKRTRPTRNFPASTFTDAEAFAKKVYEIGAGQSVKRLTLFDEIGKSPDSGASRMLVTNAGRYGLTKGGYQAENIEPTDLSLRMFSDKNTERERQKAKIEAAIEKIDPFNGVYNSIVGNKLPAVSVLVDKIKEFEVSDHLAAEAVDTLILNLRDVGLLKTLSGAERIISIDMLLEELPSTREQGIVGDLNAGIVQTNVTSPS